MSSIYKCVQLCIQVSGSVGRAGGWKGGEGQVDWDCASVNRVDSWSGEEDLHCITTTTDGACFLPLSAHPSPAARILPACPSPAPRAQEGARVFSLSLGYYCDGGVPDALTLQMASDIAAADGLLVAAAGNGAPQWGGGKSGWDSVRFRGCLRGAGMLLACCYVQGRPFAHPFPLLRTAPHHFTAPLHHTAHTAPHPALLHTVQTGLTTTSRATSPRAPGPSPRPSPTPPSKWTT